MKNILKLGALAASLLISVSAFAVCRTNSCAPKCAPRCETRCEPTCKLPSPECAEIELTTTCQGTPEFHWECRKVYHTCEDRNTSRKVRVKERCLGVEVDGAKVAYDGGEKAYAPKAKKLHKKMTSKKTNGFYE